MKNSRINELYFISHGAAIIIQKAWRAFYKTENNVNNNNNRFCETDDDKYSSSSSSVLSRKASSNYLSEKTDLSRLVNNCLYNFFKCDVEIIVENRRYVCHSVVLWSSSGLFRSMLDCDNRDSSDHMIRFYIETFVECWDYVYLFIYGYEAELPKDKKIINHLFRLIIKLEIYNLIEKFNLNDKIREKSNYLSDVNSFSLKETSSESIYEYDKLETGCSFLGISPKMLLSDSYKTLKLIINMFETGVFSFGAAYKHLLNRKLIDYNEMSENQLQNTLYLLKTKMKLKNSTLIPQIIDIYMKK